MQFKENPRVEIISLMRGFFACPLIAFFHKEDLIQIFFKNKFSLNSFKKIKNKFFLKNILLYFVSLNLIKITNRDKYFFKSTILGKKIFLRSGSFLLLHSYKSFVADLNKNLILNAKNSLSCDRAENVVGSGSINNKKFFPAAINLLKNENYDLIADIGCGDGNFLTQISKKFNKTPLFATDISQVAINKTKNNLKKIKSKKFYFRCDASKVNKWSSYIKKNCKLNQNSKILVTIWFILHEISNKNPKKIIDFFKILKKKLPNASILIGEITKFNLKTLSRNKNTSIMPEFLFFHELSGQGLMSNKEFKYVLKEIPYKLKKLVNLTTSVLKIEKNHQRLYGC